MKVTAKSGIVMIQIGQETYALGREEATSLRDALALVLTAES